MSKLWLSGLALAEYESWCLDWSKPTETRGAKNATEIKTSNVAADAQRRKPVKEDTTRDKPNIQFIF